VRFNEKFAFTQAAGPLWHGKSSLRQKSSVHFIDFLTRFASTYTPHKPVSLCQILIAQFQFPLSTETLIVNARLGLQCIAPRERALFLMLGLAEREFSIFQTQFFIAFTLSRSRCFSGIGRPRCFHATVCLCPCSKSRLFATLSIGK
jgi:hypothetical protein